MKISVLGSGGWGTALSILSYNCSHKTVLWGKFQDEIETIKTTLENPLLKGVEIPENIVITSEIKKIKNSDIVIIATPSFAEQVPLSGLSATCHFLLVHTVSRLP